MLRSLRCQALGAAVCAFALAAADAQNVTLSPFVTILPSGGPRPMAGLALTLDGPLALRASGDLAIQERSPLGTPGEAKNTLAMRPWGADADAIARLERLSYGTLLTFSPYVFAGVGIGAVDSGTYRFTRTSWSYGSGLALPLGSVVELLGEWRWRMNRFVLPNAPDAPSPVSEARFGIAFRVGGQSPIGEAMPVIPSGDESGALQPVSARVLSAADRYIGTRYRRGGASPSTGFDAAGFVRFVFAQFGVLLPQTSRSQARVGERVRADWQVIAPGDLVMFEDDGGINHVAIYVGRGRIIHSSETGGGVRYDDLETERGRWFLDHLVAARRVTPDLRGLLLDLAREFQREDASNADAPDHAPRASLRKRR